MSKRVTISERMRAAILQSPQTRADIAAATGVAPSVLSRFVHRKNSIDMATADKLAAHLGLDLVAIKRKVKR